MKRTILLLSLILTVAFAENVFSQANVRGVIKDAQTEEVLAGALVVVEGTTIGVITDINGNFNIKIPEGQQTLDIGFLGFESQLFEVDVERGQTKNIGIIKLEPMTFGITGIQVVADRAKERETPVAFSSLSRQEIQEVLGSRDVPLALNITPNVYSTEQGGGAGDARINVRGFNQSNVAIMLNGVPVNDMENGWVYWSNWDGIADATSSIQMQRGLSAINLATPSIGGTMNVISSPAEREAGFTYRQEAGSGNFFKGTLFGHTGLVDDTWALSAGVVRKVGDGIVDGTWTDAWAYYLGASFILNENNRLEVYALGAPQRHGQNLYKQNIAAYDQEYAKELGYTQAALNAFPEANSGRFYNQNWNTASSVYYNRQWWNGKKHQRYSPYFINERENFYHKPLANVNWYSKLSESASLFTTAYYSGGQGGGSGTLGSVAWDYSGPSRIVDWQSTIENNMASDTSQGILRNSRNNQWTVGAISKLKWRINDNLTTSFGIDTRLAEIEHYREVRDLLGGNYFHFTGNEFETSPSRQLIGLGDKVDYNFTNTVKWLGGYAQGEYKSGDFTGFAMAGYSVIDYYYVNHFVAGSDGNELTQESGVIGGYQVKGGGNYNLTETFNTYVNVGYVSKVPIFDAVIDDRSGALNDNPVNETFISAELGSSYKSKDGSLFLAGNLYYTVWNDRANTISVLLENGNEGLISLQGMDQLHYGAELEGVYQPADWLTFNLAGSINNWLHTSDASGTFKDWSDPTATNQDFNFYVKDLKVGDAPQMQGVAGVTFLYKGLRTQLLSRHYAEHYAYWEPFSRTDPTDREQVWKVPNYSVYDLHLTFDVPFDTKAKVQIFAHVFNVLNATYVQDATDNSRYNAYMGAGDVHSHTAMAAEVFLGLPRRVNVGMHITF